MRWAVRFPLVLIAFALAAAAQGSRAEVRALGDIPPGTEKRVALVVGNSSYKNVPALGNTANDARLVADTLRSLGFRLVGDGPQIDLDRAGFEQALRSFGRAIGGADVALFYYAGHGVQVQGTNWLVPTSANPESVTDLDYEMVDADLVLKQMQGARTLLNIVILDACRNNPFGGQGFRNAAAGLAQMTAPEGTLISYATQPGAVAHDGIDGHSPYTRALAATLPLPGLDLFQVFNTVGLQVKRDTGGDQQPWVSSSPIDGNFYFAGLFPTPVQPPPLAAATAAAATATAAAAPSPAVPPVVDTPASAPAPAIDKEALFWDSIKDSKNSADFREYLKKYPKGSFVGLARNRIAALGKAQTRHTEEKVAVVPPPAPPKEPPPSAYELMTRGKAAHDRGDYAEAMRWYRRAADLGNANAMENIGMLYHTGRGIIRDDAEALRWWRKAADLGGANAMNHIGAAYRDGQGVNRDYVEAMRWFRQSSELGNAHAMTAIGFLYQHALGVKLDYAEAIRWYRKAAALGDARARQRLQQLGSLTTGAPPSAFGPPVAMPPPRPGAAFGH
jgi:TPR repeat protein